MGRLPYIEGVYLIQGIHRSLPSLHGVSFPELVSDLLYKVGGPLGGSVPLGGR